MLRKVIALVIVLTTINSLKADEGMWLPLHIKRLNQVDMEANGLQLTADEIYSVNNASLKDAIVSLGGFCTAEVISAEGLLLTNHHCAYGVIQENSNIKHDYLTDGFWAMSRKEELPAEGLTASFLVEMKDVTAEVLKDVTRGMDEDARAAKIKEVTDRLQEEATKDNELTCKIKSFFHGNEYYLFMYKTYRDIRLVGAPPSSVGKFGGDTDNWMWPRHTGDFSLLRIYGDKDGNPADYSADNVPFKPKHHLPISLKGVKESDFSMIMGYPGRTNRFLTSYGVKQAVDANHPARVKIRGERLGILKEDMDASDETRIKYASKYAQVSNYHKYFQGQIRGLKRLNVYEKKSSEEEAFSAWIESNTERKNKYGKALGQIENAYKDLDKVVLAQVYLFEAIFGAEVVSFSSDLLGLYRVLSSENVDEEKVKETAQLLKETAKNHFKDYNSPTDQKVLAALIEMYYNDIPKESHPEILTEIHAKYKGDFSKYAATLFKKSIFVDPEGIDALLAEPSKKAFEKDPAFQLTYGFLKNYSEKIRPATTAANAELEIGMRDFSAGLREMQSAKKFYPDANSTMRLTYGKVKDYYPRDAVYYNYFTTLDGVMEKEIPNDGEFHVPEKLKQLYAAKDYGKYGEDGTMKICFITDNDITGGNSGSPVINGSGELIGCAFDGNWEAMSGDIAFETEFQRTISTDIRYILFIIDKYAGAGHIVDEMTLVSETKSAAIEHAPIEMN